MSSIYDSDINKVIDDAFNALSDKRKKHTQNVMEEAKHLAEKYGADVDKALFSAKCHDLFRGLDINEINSLIKEYKLDDRYLNNANLAHGKIAEKYVSELGLKDEEVLDAISFHTTGRAGMTLLEKIIFIADAIEPLRDYPGVDKLRKLTYEDIDDACLLSLEGTIKHLRKSGVPEESVDKDTIEAADYYRSVRKEELNDK